MTAATNSAPLPPVEADQFSNHDGIAAAIRRALAMLKPPPDMLPSAWSEDNVRIPSGNAIPGPYRIANAPYQREPMDMLVNPDCYRVTLMWGAQVGKTLTLLCMQGYCIAMRPRSQMMMQPSQGDVQTWLETKFNPLVESSPAIAARIAKPRGREGVNNQRMKAYPGGFIMFSWSGSPKTMRGRSAPFIGCDETDGYQRTAEGHPVNLLWQRAATFGDERFLVEISTPTIEDSSHIESSFNDGDRRRFYVRCPHCDTAQVMRWEFVTWQGRQSSSIDDAEKDRDADSHRPETAAYMCPHCSGVWNDGQRIAAIRTAEESGAGWQAEREFKGHASYHLWEAYSTMRKLRDIVTDYLSRLRTDDLQTFVNVSLSQTYALKGDKANSSALEARAEEFAARVPAGGVYLTAGIDMQTDRLEVEVVAWGEGEESWSVDYRVLWGDPLSADVWEDLDALLAEKFEHESGHALPIMAACLDTGGTAGYTQAAYEYLRGKTGRRLFGIKGYAPSFGAPIVEKVLRKQSGRNARKVDLFRVAVDEAKLVVMRRLGLEKAGPGYCHVPSDRESLAEWCAQITAEKLQVHYIKGQPVREWTKADRARNEALDCRVYALAALKIMQPSIRRYAANLANLAAQRGVTTPAPVKAPAAARATPAPAPAPAPSQPEKAQPALPQRTGRPIRKNWATGWKG